MLGIPALTAEALLAGFRAMGLDATAISRGTGLEEVGLEGSDTRVDVSIVSTLLERAWAQAPREEFPTEVGLAIPFGAFGVLDYLAGSAETVGAAMVSLRDHFRAVTSGLVLDILPDATGVWLRALTKVKTERQEVGEELAVAVNVGRFRSLATLEHVVDAVELTRPSPLVPTRHSELLRAPVSFGHAAAGMHVPSRALDAPMKTSDPLLRRTMAEVAARLCIAGDGAPDLEIAIRSRLRGLLAHGSFDVEEVARSLGLSKRSMHRKLSELGRTYQAVLDDFRAGEAERLLVARKDSLAQIALSLGFADQTAFNRAFRRWKGTTPSAWLAERSAARAR